MREELELLLEWEFETVKGQNGDDDITICRCPECHSLSRDQYEECDCCGARFRKPMD